jgi:hypothetical protein
MSWLLKTIGSASVVCGLAVGIPAVAHHSTTMFDHTKSLTIKGKVVEIRWVNPHATVSVTGAIKEGGAAETWLMEMTSPGNLARVSGWTRTSVKVGDDVVVDFSPLRNEDNKGGALRKLTLVSTGQSFTTNIRDQERPGIGLD